MKMSHWVFGLWRANTHHFILWTGVQMAPQLGQEWYIRIPSVRKPLLVMPQDRTPRSQDIQKYPCVHMHAHVLKTGLIQVKWEELQQSLEPECLIYVEMETHLHIHLFLNQPSTTMCCSCFLWSTSILTASSNQDPFYLRALLILTTYSYLPETKVLVGLVSHGDSYFAQAPLTCEMLHGNCSCTNPSFMATKGTDPSHMPMCKSSITRALIAQQLAHSERMKDSSAWDVSLYLPACNCSSMSAWVCAPTTICTYKL